VEKPSQTAAQTPQGAMANLAEGVDAVKASADRLSDVADRRTQLATDRTIFAAERTYAAWVRTGLAALASGVGARTLLKGLVPDWMVGATGSLLILFSAFCFVSALWRELFAPSSPRPDVRRLPAGLLILFNGFLMLVALAALVGVWSGVHPD
jgi:putative membrane protein